MFKTDKIPGVSRLLDFQITKIVAILEKKKKNFDYRLHVFNIN